MIFPKKFMMTLEEGYYNENLRKMAIAIGNGIPLPKGHGRLIDADKLCQTPIDSTDLPYGKSVMVYDVDEIADAPTIVDADKENEDE